MLMYVIRGHNTNPWTGRKSSLLGGKRDAIYLDAPQLRVHAPKILLWWGWSFCLGMLWHSSSAGHFTLYCCRAASEVPYLLELINIFSPFCEPPWLSEPVI